MERLGEPCLKRRAPISSSSFGPRQVRTARYHLGAVLAAKPHTCSSEQSEGLGTPVVAGDAAES